MFETLFGEGQYGLKFVFAFIVVLALIALTAWLVRRFGAERLGAGTARGRQPRLAVIDAASVDGRRRLVLIRRDNVEHLMMIGGPTDVVVEANIVRAAAPPRDAQAPRPPAATDTLPRAVPLGEGSMWPLQPEPAPAPAPPPRRRASSRRPCPASRIGTPSRRRPPPSVTAEEEAGVDRRTGAGTAATSIAAGAASAGPASRRIRLRASRTRSPAPSRRSPSRRQQWPSRVRCAARREFRARRRPPPAPPPPPAPAPEPPQAAEPPFNSPADQNLAEMAHRLEAALRRPGKPEGFAEPPPRRGAELRGGARRSARTTNRRRHSAPPPRRRGQRAARPARPAPTARRQRRRSRRSTTASNRRWRVCWAVRQQVLTEQPSRAARWDRRPPEALSGGRRFSATDSIAGAPATGRLTVIRSRRRRARGAAPAPRSEAPSRS